MGNTGSRGRVINNSPYGSPSQVRGMTFPPPRPPPRPPPHLVQAPVYPQYQRPPPCPEGRKLKVPILTAARHTGDEKLTHVKAGESYGTAEICSRINSEEYYINLDTLRPPKELESAKTIGTDSIEYKFTFVDEEEIRYAPDRLEKGTRILVKLDAVGGGRYSKKKIRKHKKRNTTRRK